MPIYTHIRKSVYMYIYVNKCAHIYANVCNVRNDLCTCDFFSRSFGRRPLRISTEYLPGLRTNVEQLLFFFFLSFNPCQWSEPSLAGPSYLHNAKRENCPGPDPQKEVVNNDFRSSATILCGRPVIFLFLSKYFHSD